MENDQTPTQQWTAMPPIHDERDLLLVHIDDQKAEVFTDDLER